MVEKFKIPDKILQVSDTLERAGFVAYLVGGCVRDLILGKRPQDWDLATNATPEQLLALFPKAFYENSFGTVTVLNEDQDVKSDVREVQVTPFRLEGRYSDKRHPDSVKFSDKLEDDLQRRDFTINALAYFVSEEKLTDLYAGQKDIRDKLVRTVGNPDERFNEDPLRILRGIRFAVQLGFSIASETTESMFRNSALIKAISTERIRDELIKILLSPNPMVGLLLCHKLGVLKHFLPETEEGIQVKQNGDHIYDVWEHTLRVVQHAADKNYSLEVRLACLLHDIAKPRTREFSQEKRDFTFYGHETLGAKMATNILNRLKFSRETTEKVANLVRNHMFFSDTEQITLSAVRRIIARVGRKNIRNLLELRWCDRIGMGRPKENPYRLRKFQAMIDEALRQPTSVGMLKIGGEEVMRETGLKSGPKVGYILHALLEEVLEKPDLNKTEYLVKQAKNMAKMEETELKKLAEKGKKKIEKLEMEALDEIKKRHFVK